MVITRKKVEDLIDQLPLILDQSYDALCEEAAVGKGRKVILAASNVYQIHSGVKGVITLNNRERKQLDVRLEEAAYAVNAIIECFEGANVTIGSPSTPRRAYELLDQMATQLKMSVFALQRERK
jgi:hypothetical protein